MSRGSKQAFRESTVPGLPRLPYLRVVTTLIGVILASCQQPLRIGEAPNILFIVVDDLNDSVGFLDERYSAYTPNMDRLAREGVTFVNAHAQGVVCTPSRSSFLTGRYPHETGLYFLEPTIKQAELSVTTLPEWMSSMGYRTFSTGKIFHSDDQLYFDEFHGYGGRNYGNYFGPFPDKLRLPNDRRVPADKKIRWNSDDSWVWDWGPYPESDTLMPDYWIAEEAVELLGKHHERPFFIAVGFVRPHMPLYVPPRWYESVSPDSLPPPILDDSDLSDLPEYGRRLTGVGGDMASWFRQNPEMARDFVRSYVASVRFVDHQLGRVLNALDNGPFANNTIVVLLSDHGFHLGEKSHWGKSTLWRESTRVPLVIRIPGRTSPTKVEEPVGLIDIFPTLAELTGFEVDLAWDGSSLLPLVNDSASIVGHLPVLSTLGPGNHALRSDKWTYIRYRDGSEELYDIRRDPDERNNIAMDSTSARIIGQFGTFLPVREHPIRSGNE